MNYNNKNDEKSLTTVVELNNLLADYHLYYQNLRNFHWNILGRNFFDLHNKFEELYSDARIKIDEIAERILTLNFHPISSFSEYIQISNIKEVNSLLEDREMVITIIKNQNTILTQMKKVIKEADKANDEGTIDIMGGYIKELEKESWMLNAWSKQGNEKLNSAVTNA